MSDELSTLEIGLEGLNLDPSAVAWLVDLFAVIQVFDDVADGDPVSTDDLYRAIWATLVDMPKNAFFLANIGALLPVVAVQIMKWQCANVAETSGNADARSFVWRAGFYDIVLLATHICGASDGAALNMYGEKFDEYMKEFS